MPSTPLEPDHLWNLPSCGTTTRPEPWHSLECGHCPHGSSCQPTVCSLLLLLSLLPLERPVHRQERWSLLLTKGSIAPRECWHPVGTQELRARSACVNESWRKGRWQVQGPHDCSRREERTCPVSELVTGEWEEECPARDPWSLRRWHLDAPQGQSSVGLQMGSRAGEAHSARGCGHTWEPLTRRRAARGT